MSEKKEKAPKLITMPGMIYRANEVLKWAMDPKTGGLHPDLFGPNLLGIAFISVIEAGFVFSGNVGTGIVLSRNDDDGSWSPPCAIGMTGVGWGFIMGASMKDVVYLIYDPETMRSFTGDVGFKIGTQAEASFGNWGRSAETAFNVTNRGVGTNVALSYSRGLFGGIAIEGALCNPRTNVNVKFYGRDVSPKEILTDRRVAVPDGTLMPEVYDKLTKLCSGESIYEITAAEEAKAEAIRLAAEKEGEEHLKEEDVKIEHVPTVEETKEVST